MCTNISNKQIGVLNWSKTNFNAKKKKKQFVDVIYLYINFVTVRIRLNEDVWIRCIEEFYLQVNKGVWSRDRGSFSGEQEPPHDAPLLQVCKILTPLYTPSFVGFSRLCVVVLWLPRAHRAPAGESRSPGVCVWVRTAVCMLVGVHRRCFCVTIIVLLVFHVNCALAPFCYINLLVFAGRDLLVYFF